MNARFAIVLVVLLVVLGGGAVLNYQRDHARQASNVTALGKPLLGTLKAAEITAIRIVEPKATLTLVRRDGVWRVAERAGFPADFSQVRDFVVKAIGVKIAQSEPIGEKDRARLLLGEPGKDGAGTRVEFLGAKEKQLAQMFVGKKYFKTEPDDAVRAPGDGRFVMLPRESKTVYIVSDPLTQASTKTGNWVDKTGYSAEKVKTLEVRFQGGAHWQLSRDSENAEWKLKDAAAGEKLEVTSANSATYSLSLLGIDDVAAPGLTPAQTGLDTPTVIHAITLDGLDYTFRVGKLEGENYYVDVTIGGELAKTRVAGEKESDKDKTRFDKEFEERVAKIKARLPREQALTKHTVLIARSKFDDVLKQRAELLEKKEATKK